MKENSCLKLPQMSNTGVEKNELHSNIDLSFDHQMSLCKSKCWYSNNCLHFLKCAVPFSDLIAIEMPNNWNAETFSTFHTWAIKHGHKSKFTEAHFRLHARRDAGHNARSGPVLSSRTRTGRSRRGAPIESRAAFAVAQNGGRLTGRVALTAR